ncbi:MAG: hypothetical protein ABW098_17535 [Candidatus Thiodiazotropha sp.]
MMYESFDDYIEYMEKYRGSFPLEVYEFAVDVNRHNLDSPHSLHDSWMTSITIKENRKIQRPFNPEPSIELVFLGQMHDRDIILNYAGVESYKIEGIKNQFNSSDTFQGDISCHEVRLSEEGLIVHEILFASGSTIIITCKNFECSESLHA